MKLTATTIRAAQLPRGKTEAIIFDDDIPGFGLRLREGGSRTFVFQYKLGTKQRRMALGSAAALKLPDVRETAEKLHARIKLGHDPASDKAQARAQAAQTFKPAAELYLEKQRAKLRPRSYPDLERHLLKHAKSLHELQLTKVTRQDVASVISSVTKNSGAVTANRVRGSLSAFFSWAMAQGMVDANPVIGTARNEEHSRERVLAPAEIRAIWQALENDYFGDIIRLLALTGQREAEIAGLGWTEVNEDKIVLAGERTKNHRAHVVPLSEPAQAIIEKQEHRKDRDLIFGNGAGPFSGWSSCKNRLDNRIAKANDGKGIAPWRIHDLRRTFATYVGGGMPAHELEKLPARDKDWTRGLGVQPHVIEAVLNHVSGHKAGVAGIYNRSTYEPEKKQALDLWAEHLLAIVEARSPIVVPLKRA